MGRFDPYTNYNKSEDELSEPLLLCSPCQSVRYCSKACQKDHRNAHKVKCFGEWTPFVPPKPCSSDALPDLIPCEDDRETEEPLLARSPYGLPCLPSVSGDYSKECLYLFLIRLRTSDWSETVRAFHHLFPHHLTAFALSKLSTESHLRSLWMRQTYFPTNPAAMRAEAQELKDMGEPFRGLGSQAGQTFGLAAVEKLLQETLDKAGISLGCNVQRLPEPFEL